MSIGDDAIDVVEGTPESLRGAAASLYDAAFGQKLALAVQDRSARLSLLAISFQLRNSFAAIAGGQLVGLAGFHGANGSLTGGLDYRGLMTELGFWRGQRAAIILALFERRPVPGELLMDGIAVRADMRGRGVGTRLLKRLADYGEREGYRRIRLDVIETNPRARQLYERHGFVATETSRFGYLRWLLGFGAATTMIRPLPGPDAWPDRALRR